jgi:hypothetical protein
MSNRHSVRNTQFKKAIKHVHSFLQDNLKINNNHVILLHTTILEYPCAVLKIGESIVRASLNEFRTCNSQDKKNCFLNRRCYNKR